MPQTCDQTPCAGLDAHTLGAEILRLLDQFARHDAVVEDVLLVVDVVDESVQCIDALRETARDDVPFALDDESRNDVERPLAIDRAAAFTGVDGERDAHRPDGDLGSGLARGEFLIRQPGQHAAEIFGALAGATAIGDEFVPDAGGLVLRPVDRHFFLCFATAF